MLIMRLALRPGFTAGVKGCCRNRPAPLDPGSISLVLPVTPEQFIATWKNNSLTEKGGAQPHFEDLCRMLGVEPPRQYGEYCYEQDLKKMHGGNGFADVWKRGCFAWENKGPDKDLGPALAVLRRRHSPAASAQVQRRHHRRGGGRVCQGRQGDARSGVGQPAGRPLPDPVHLLHV